MRPITSIVLHHSLTIDNIVREDTNAIRRYHIDVNKWKDIGYHLVQESIGDLPNLVIGRPWSIAGAHAPGRNTDSLGYCIVGNFDLAPPDEYIWAFAVKTVRWLMEVFSIQRKNIFGHKEVTPDRTCPGAFFNLEKFRASV